MLSTVSSIFDILPLSLVIFHTYGHELDRIKNILRLSRLLLFLENSRSNLPIEFRHKNNLIAEKKCI
jgi:hypothetical protein